MHASTHPNTWWERIGASIPVVCAPMGGVAGGRLAHAVTSAGALGMIGMGSSGSRAALERELAAFAAAGPPVRFGIGLVDWGIERMPEMLDVALDASPVLLSVSFGDYTRSAVTGDWIARATERGILTITQAANADEAERAVDAGVSAVVARGLEGGGHGSPESERDPLLQAIVRRVGDRVPVLAAGAISNRRDLEHVLAQGAAGAWVGTAFTACPESLSSDENRAVLIAAGSNDTHITREFDLAQGLPWPERFPERVITGTPVNAGMGVGALTEARSATEVVASFRSVDG